MHRKDAVVAGQMPPGRREDGEEAADEGLGLEHELGLPGVVGFPQLQPHLARRQHREPLLRYFAEFEFVSYTMDFKGLPPSSDPGPLDLEVASDGSDTFLRTWIGVGYSY